MIYLNCNQFISFNKNPLTKYIQNAPDQVSCIYLSKFLVTDPTQTVCLILNLLTPQDSVCGGGGGGALFAPFPSQRAEIL